MFRGRTPSDDEEDLLLDESDRAPVHFNETNPAQRLNLAQRAIGGFIRFADPTATVVVGAAIARYADVEIPVPGEYAATAIAWLATREMMDGVNTLVRQENPLRYLRAMGGGHFVKGLAKDVLKKSMATAPLIGLWVGVSYGRDALFNMAIGDVEHYQNLLLAMTYLDSPALRTLLVAAVSLPFYTLGQKMLEKCCLKVPEWEPENNPQTRWYQDVMKGGTRIFYGVMAAEFAREVFNTGIGFAVVLHDPYSLVIGPVCELFFREPLYYVSHRPHPMMDAAITCGTPRVEVLDELALVDTRPEPNKCQQAAGVSTRFAIVCVVFGAATLASKYVEVAIAGQANDDREDPASWTYAGRMGYESLLVGGCVFAYGMTMLVPQAVKKVGQWCGMFSRPQERIQLEERELINPDLSHLATPDW